MYDRASARRHDSSAQRARDVRHAAQDSDLHRFAGGSGDTFADHLAQLGSEEPGSKAFMEARLIGSMAPEPILEIYGPIGPEGFGVIRRVRY